VRRALFVALCTGALTLPASARADVIVPDALAGVEGNSNNGFPFNIQGFGLASQRYQQVFDSSEFSSAVLITGITFRPDAQQGSAFASVLPNVQIDFSTTLFGPDALSTTFATNVGADNTTVFSGALNLSSAYTGPAAGPKDFDISIVFSTPFLYNPALGHLLLDVRNFGGGLSTQFDSHALFGDAVSRVISNNVNALIGGADTAGLVTEFQVQQVPEPSTFLLVSGIVVAAARRIRRVRRSR
jgi:hypothetical protein